MRRLIVSLFAFFGLAAGALADTPLIHKTGTEPAFSIGEDGKWHRDDLPIGPLVQKGTDVTTLSHIAEALCRQMVGDQATITDPYFDATNDVKAHGRVSCELDNYHAQVDVKSTPETATFTVHVDLEQLHYLRPFTAKNHRELQK